MVVAYHRRRPDLAPPMLSFPVLFLWHQKCKWKWKKEKKKKTSSSDFLEDYHTFIENGANSKRFWSGWATLWGMVVIQMFVPFLSCHCTIILNEFWVLSFNILSISVKRKIPSPTDISLWTYLKLHLFLVPLSSFRHSLIETYLKQFVNKDDVNRGTQKPSSIFSARSKGLRFLT